VLQLTRVRGEQKQVDKSRTNLTAGLHLGYFFIPALSAGAELRYQRWLSTPDNVKKDKTGTLRDTLTFAIGVRGHIKLNESLVLRPGIAYVRGLDAPMSKQHYNVFQLDVPLQF
jgi:long-subunit fatty acid transport protein